tara:strand:- start:1174 stop:1761 length:588 start_codon:yes stop_codon:yes gene_type:complete
MVLTTKKAFLCQMFLAMTIVSALSLPTLADDTTLASPKTDPADAQAHCAGPVQRFMDQLNAADADVGRRIDDVLRDEFVRNLERCRASYQYQLKQLEIEFNDLAVDAYCHSVRREFIDAESLFDIAVARVRQLPLNGDEEQRTAVDFFAHASDALVRSVNGLFLLRHGICVEERITPFDQPPFGGSPSQTYSHIE